MNLEETSNKFDDNKLGGSYVLKNQDEYKNCLTLNEYLNDYLNLENTETQFYFAWNSIQKLSQKYLYGPYFWSFKGQNITASKVNGSWKVI